MSPSPNSFRTGPDERGHFGLFGGRYVAETLMPLILELEKAYNEAKADPQFQGELKYLLIAICRPAEPALLRRAADQEAGRRQGLPEARRAEPHGQPQDQQRAGPGAAGQAHGQDARDRRDGSRTAWRRHGDGLRAVRHSLRRVHGLGRRRPSGAQRVPHEDAGRGSASGEGGCRHAQGCDERGPARLGRDLRDDLLLHRHGGWAASLSGDGARLPVRDR